MLEGKKRPFQLQYITEILLSCKEKRIESEKSPNIPICSNIYPTVHFIRQRSNITEVKLFRAGKLGTTLSAQIPALLLLRLQDGPNEEILIRLLLVEGAKTGKRGRGGKTNRKTNVSGGAFITNLFRSIRFCEVNAVFGKECQKYFCRYKIRKWARIISVMKLLHSLWNTSWIFYRECKNLSVLNT